MSSSRVILRSVAGTTVFDTVRDICNELDLESLIPLDGTVVVKVNLSTPFSENADSSNTSPELLDAVCRLLTERTKNVFVVESDGMRYKTEEAFEVSGYVPILDRYGLKPTSLSKQTRRQIDDPFIKDWGLPELALDADAFITLPVLKTHATTVFTGALKNQFGCYPQHNRILLHRDLDRAIVLINQLLKPKLAIMDGIIGMEGRGPINGEPRDLGLLLGSRDIVALDATAMRLVGLDPHTSKHIVKASSHGLGRIDPDDIDVDGDFDAFSTTFKPAEKDLPIRLLGLIARSRFLTERLILDPESFYPLRKAAMRFRDVRDFMLGLVRPRRV